MEHNLDKMKNNIDILNGQLNKIVKDMIFIGNWDKARKLAKEHDATKKKRMARKKHEKNNEKNNASIVGKKKYITENMQPACGGIQKNNVYIMVMSEFFEMVA